MRTKSQVAWSNRSVLRFAGNRNPIAAIESRAQQLALDAIDKGWHGPPYDPLALADALGIKLVPQDEIRDARLVVAADGRPMIEFNPNRPRNRIRFSIAHEIIHAQFPDFHHKPRYRNASTENDEWQLELLCNLGAAELLMPTGNLGELQRGQLSIDWILEKRKQLEVSTEALLLRVVRLAEFPCAAFCVSQLGSGTGNATGRLDYLVASRAWTVKIRSAESMPLTRTLSGCAAIGYTAKGDERWSPLDEFVRVECIGLPSYEGLVLPRVAGLLFPKGIKEGSSLRRIEYLKGDALSPRGNPPHIIAHILNDRTPNWGGRGIAVALKNRWPHVQSAFRDWVAEDPRRLHLGKVQAVDVAPGVVVCNMIAQHGYGPSETPRIRYGSVKACLEQLRELALQKRASIHMPRIGTGQARGSWEVIEELIEGILVGAGCAVTVYDLPQ